MTDRSVTSNQNIHTDAGVVWVVGADGTEKPATNGQCADHIDYLTTRLTQAETRLEVLRALIDDAYNHPQDAYVLDRLHAALSDNSPAASKSGCTHSTLSRGDTGPWYCVEPHCGFTLWPADETTDSHEADLANQLQAVDQAYRAALKELDALKARVPSSDYVLVSDMVEGHHTDYGLGLFATRNAIRSAVETSSPITPAEMSTVARMAAVSAQVQQPEKAETES